MSSNEKERKSNEKNDGIAKDESQCYICLTTRVNPCYADGCLHQFCTNCLMEWSKSSNQCPVCRTTFENLLINVKSDSEYEQIPIQAPSSSGQQQLALENLLDLIIGEITRNLPEAIIESTNRANAEGQSTSNGSRERVETTMGRNLVNDMREINNQRDLTVQSANESLHQWKRVSRDRRRRRRPKLISKSIEPPNDNSSSSEANSSRSNNNQQPSSSSNVKSETKKTSGKKLPSKDRKDTM